MWKAQAGLKVSAPQAGDTDDDWETEADYENDVSEKQQRWGAKTVNGSEHQDSLSVQQLREKVQEDISKGKKNELDSGAKASNGYGGKFGTQKDRMDQPAVGFKYDANVAKHASQPDHSSVFGGKDGVQKDKNDKSAIVRDHQERVKKHELKQDHYSGFGGRDGVQKDKKDKSAIVRDHQERVKKHESKQAAPLQDTVNMAQHGEDIPLTTEVANVPIPDATPLTSMFQVENKCLKAVLGIVSGFVIGGLLYVVLYYSFGYTALHAGIIAICSTVIMSVCLAISCLCRCAIALVFCNFFTGKGRAVFLSIIFGLIISNPVANIAYNAKETGSSMACIVELAANQTRVLQGQLSEPMKKVEAYIKKQTNELKIAGEDINAAFGEVSSALNKVNEGLDDAIEGVKDIFKKCEDGVSAVYDDCNRHCDSIGRHTLGILDDLSKPCRDACNTLPVVSQGCDVFKDVGSSVTNVARTVVDKTRESIDDVLNLFVFDVFVDNDYMDKANLSTSASAIQDQVNKDIASKVSAFEAIISVVKKVLSVSLALVFFQAFWYVKNYLAKDSYDNFYITKQFKKLDKKLGREAILPLTKKENGVYVETSSWKLNKIELEYCKLGLVHVLLHLLFCLVVIIFDYTLFYILNLIKRFGHIVLTAQAEGKFTINIEGTGLVAKFYRLMIGELNLDQSYTANLDIDHCLPSPKTPATEMIPILLSLYCVAFLFVILRGYGMRIRREISAYYYPDQECARLDYLHKKIKLNRVSFLKCLEKHQLSKWLESRFPWLKSCLPDRSRREEERSVV